MLDAILLALREFFFLFSYVAGRNSFPKPLSSAEEAENIAKMQEGDEAARGTLIEHNLRLVAYIAKKYQNTGIDQDDLISIGTIGLIKGVSTFRPGSTALATYAARCIENEILMTIRSTRKLKREVSLSEPIGTDKDGCEISLIDILASEEDDVIDVIERRLEAGNIGRLVLTELDERERLVMVLRYGMLDGITRAQREVAKTMGISRSYVSRIETRAIQKLHAKLYGKDKNPKI